MRLEPSPLQLLLSCALVGVFGWQVVAGAERMLAYGRADWGREGMFETEEQRVARAFGDYYEELCLLRERVPENGVVFCNLLSPEGHPNATRDVFLLNRLRHALHPRFVAGLDFRDAAQRATLPADPPDHMFVCDFDPGAGERPPEPLVRLAQTARFELWGVR